MGTHIRNLPSSREFEDDPGVRELTEKQDQNLGPLISISTHSLFSPRAEEPEANTWACSCGATVSPSGLDDIDINPTVPVLKL